METVGAQPVTCPHELIPVPARATHRVAPTISNFMQDLHIFLGRQQEVIRAAHGIGHDVLSALAVGQPFKMPD